MEELKKNIKNSVALLLILLFSKAYSQTHERWAVKTLTDGFAPDTMHVKQISVNAIHSQKRIRVSDTQARLPSEKQVVTITGTISTIKQEKGKHGDMDYHIEICDGSLGDSTFVCEAVYPNDSITKYSPYIVNFNKVHALAKTLVVGDKVSLTGVLYQDQYHKPSNHRSRNFIEMHPILKARKVD